MSAQQTLAGRYELVQAVGRGGMGQVWSATDTRLRRQVAVKTVDLDTATDAVAAERFQQEAQATAALSHPNIVTIFDSGVDGSTAFLVMELLSGPSLEALVRDEGALPVDRALEYVGEVASALGAAHAAGIVHRDIKPSNLMLDGRGSLKVVDFGIARLDQEKSSKLTATATVVGSAPYLSPEQATGGVATAQSDLYSLGCVLLALITGEPPFDGEHPLSVLHQHLSAPPPLPSERRPGVSPAVDELAAQLLAKSPADRPASAKDVADRVQAIRRGHAGGADLPVAGTNASTTVLPPVAGAAAAGGDDRHDSYDRTATQRTAAAVPVRDDEDDRDRRGGGGAGWLVALLLLLLALGGGAWYFLAGPGAGNSSKPTPSKTVTATATPTPTPSSTSSAPEPTQTYTSTPEPTVTRTVTQTPVPAPTPTPTATRTRTPEPSPTSTPTATTTQPTAPPSPVPTTQPTAAPVPTTPPTSMPKPNGTLTIPEQPTQSS